MALDPEMFEPGTDEWMAAMRELPAEPVPGAPPAAGGQGADPEGSLVIDDATIDAWLAPVRLLGGAPAASVPFCRAQAAIEIRNHVARLRGAGWTVTPPASPEATHYKEGHQP